MPQASPWWTPDVHADRQPFLQARRRILAALRGHLEAQDFVEVETAILQRSPGNEAHLHAFATELVAPGPRAHGAPSAHLAGIRLQEAAGGRGAADLRVCPGVPQPRARRPASSGIHHARMVPGGRALRGPDGGLRGFSGRRGGRRRNHDLHLPRPQRRSLRGAGTRHRRRRLRAPRRHRPAGHASRRRAGPRRPRRPGASRRNKARRRRRLERYIQPRAGGTDRAPSRQWPRHFADGVSAGGSGARPRQAGTNPGSPSASSCSPAGSSSPTGSANSPTPRSSAGGSRPR